MADGLGMVLAWGYGYGILRANFPFLASQFIFDCSLIGFYIAQAKWMLSDSSIRMRTLNLWVFCLIAWPCIVCFFPFQEILISLVGLRGNVFFLPMLLAGAKLFDEDLTKLALWVVLLNFVALGFGIAEYILGVPKFFPNNAVTQIIYASHDVAGYQYFRIPSIFYTAHAFGGAMVTTIPLLFGLWAKRNESSIKRTLALLGMLAALIGVLLSSTRIHFVVAAVLTLTIAFSRDLGVKGRGALLVLMIILGIVATSNERFGRFKSLSNGGSVTDRIGGSVNRGFWEVIRENPLGNGLGGGGTSIPYFLMDRVHRPVMIENEYARIVLELGLIGLLLWVAFIASFIVNSAARAKTSWRGGRTVAWICVLCYWGTSFTGLGTLTAIPQSALLMLMMGWVFAKPLGPKTQLVDEPDEKLQLVYSSEITI
jgi:hypothetical protein